MPLSLPYCEQRAREMQSAAQRLRPPTQGPAQAPAQAIARRQLAARFAHKTLRLREQHRRAARCRAGPPTYRSISPKTMSSEPRMAVTSASMWPRVMKSIA